MIQTRKAKSAGLSARQKAGTSFAKGRISQGGYFIRAVKNENLTEAYFQHIRCNMFYIRQILSLSVNQEPLSDHYVLMMRMCKILRKIRQTIIDFYWMAEDANQTLSDLNQTLSIVNSILFSRISQRTDSKGRCDGNQKDHLVN